MSEIRNSIGKLIGPPFMASIDRDGQRTDKEKCAFVVSGHMVPAGYKAYIFDDTFPLEYVQNLSTYCPQSSILYGVRALDALCNYDVVEVSGNGMMHISYSDASTDNILFVTNKCNSNCIMCPDPDNNRKYDLGDRKEYLFQLIELIPSDTPHLTITGGEPTLLRWDFIDLLSACREKFPDTEFLMLSNGRSFCIKEYRNAFLEVVPKYFRLAVPLYATTAELHDKVTRSPGGFNQTMTALRSLQHEVELEIRIVIMSCNYCFLPEIAKFIAKELPGTRSVSFMGLELLGNAAISRDSLWVDYKETAPFIESAVHTLLEAGIDARIYNYPLCSLPRRLWSIAAKSITDYKVRYKPECENCSVKRLCGGFFFSTINYDKVVAIPVLEE